MSNGFNTIGKVSSMKNQSFQMSRAPDHVTSSRLVQSLSTAYHGTTLPRSQWHVKIVFLRGRENALISSAHLDGCQRAITFLVAAFRVQLRKIPSAAAQHVQKSSPRRFVACRARGCMIKGRSSASRVD